MAERACCFSDCLYYNFGEDCSPLCSGLERDITSDVCRNLLEGVCTGKEGERAFIDAWTLNGEHGLPPCLYYLSRRAFRPTPPVVWNILQDIPPPSLFNNAGTIVLLRKFLGEVFQAYSSFGYKIGSPPNSLTFSPLEYSLYSVCKNAPGLCLTVLPKVCSSYKGQDLLRVPSLANWCGCYLPEVEYTPYVNAYQVSKECTPYCSREETIPLSTPSGAEISPCRQNVCILDNVAIELLNSTIRTGARFTQICGSCGEAGRCSCISTNSNLTIINSEVGGIDFRQECRANSKCTTRVGETIIEVPCEESSEVEEKVTRDIERASRSRNGTILFLVLVAILFLGIVWWLLSLF